MGVGFCLPQYVVATCFASLMKDFAYLTDFQQGYKIFLQNIKGFTEEDLIKVIGEKFMKETSRETTLSLR